MQKSDLHAHGNMRAKKEIAAPTSATGPVIKNLHSIPDLKTAISWSIRSTSAKRERYSQRKKVPENLNA